MLVKSGPEHGKRKIERVIDKFEKKHPLAVDNIKEIGENTGKAIWNTYTAPLT